VKELSKEELMDVTGGGIGIGTGLIITAITTFVVGVIDGIIRPLRCN